MKQEEEVKERTAGNHQEDSREGSGGHIMESGPLCKWRCTKPLLTWIAQDKIFIYAIV